MRQNTDLVLLNFHLILPNWDALIPQEFAKLKQTAVVFLSFPRNVFSVCCYWCLLQLECNIVMLLDVLHHRTPLQRCSPKDYQQLQMLIGQESDLRLLVLHLTVLKLEVLMK